MRKNMAIGVLVAVLVALVATDITVRAADGAWCAWWRTNIKVCNGDVDINTDRAGAAVCSTDSECAAWEVRAGIPDSQRTYGAPVPAVRR